MKKLITFALLFTICKLDCADYNKTHNFPSVPYLDDELNYISVYIKKLSKQSTAYITIDDVKTGLTARDILTDPTPDLGNSNVQDNLDELDDEKIGRKNTASLTNRTVDGTNIFFQNSKIGISSSNTMTPIYDIDIYKSDAKLRLLSDTYSMIYNNGLTVARSNESTVITDNAISMSGLASSISMTSTDPSANPASLSIEGAKIDAQSSGGFRFYGNIDPVGSLDIGMTTAFNRIRATNMLATNYLIRDAAGHAEDSAQYKAAKMTAAHNGSPSTDNAYGSITLLPYRYFATPYYSRLQVSATDYVLQSGYGSFQIAPSSGVYISVSTSANVGAQITLATNTAVIGNVTNAGYSVRTSSIQFDDFTYMSSTRSFSSIDTDCRISTGIMQTQINEIAVSTGTIGLSMLDYIVTYENPSIVTYENPSFTWMPVIYGGNVVYFEP